MTKWPDAFSAESILSCRSEATVAALWSTSVCRAAKYSVEYARRRRPAAP